jgi:AcrR family transcriptional regulator
MARPSQGIDQALLRSGLALLPVLGCAGLSVRRVAEHAGVNPAMFHYHFGSKAAFLRTLLQQLYEQMFSRLLAGAACQGPALERLHAALATLARFVREHHAVVARLAVDAAQGEAAVHEFLRANAPRHLGLLMRLLAEAEAAGELPPGPPLPRFAFLMGAVIAPMLVLPAAAALGIAPPGTADALDALVLGDAAVEGRIALALAALRQPAEPTHPTPAAPVTATPSPPPPARPAGVRRSRR